MILPTFRGGIITWEMRISTSTLASMQKKRRSSALGKTAVVSIQPPRSHAPSSPLPLAGRMPPRAWLLDEVEVRPRPLDARLAPAAADSRRHRPEFAQRHGEGQLARTAAGRELARPLRTRADAGQSSRGRRGLAQKPTGARAAGSLARPLAGSSRPARSWGTASWRCIGPCRRCLDAQRPSSL